jgi:hypothetical protein
MTLFTILNQFETFFVSIRKLDTHISFDVKFPSNWSLPKTTFNEFQVVPFDLKEEGWRGMSFVFEFQEKEVERNVNVITKIIKLNREREEKERLFQTVVSELKKTFEKTDLTRLQNLSISFEDVETLNIIEDEGPQGETIGLAE